MSHVYVARGRNSDGADEHTGHMRGRRVGAVRAHRDQADVTLSVATELVVTLYCTQTSVLALGTTVNTSIGVG